MEKKIFLFKLFGIVFIFGILYWLQIAAPPLNQRIARLNKIVSTGKVLQMSYTDTDALRKTVTWLAAAADAGISRVKINEAYSQQDAQTGVLHVYVASAAAFYVTRCPPNNVVYDAELDAIFLDQSFVALSEWKTMLAAPDEEWGLNIPLSPSHIPSINVFFRFILLHELGHRQLHRKHGSWYASETDIRLREIQADQFALDRMENAFEIASQYGIEAIEEYTGQLIHLPVTPDMPIKNQVQTGLVEMSKVMLRAQLSLPSASATFGGRRTHPNIIERLTTLMRVASERYRGDGILQALTRYEELRAKDFTAMARLRPLEIRSMDPIISLTSSGGHNGLLVLDRAQTLKTIANSELRNYSAGAVIPETNLLMLWSGKTTPPVNVRFTAKDRPVWALPDGGVILLFASRKLNSKGQSTKWSLLPAKLRNSELHFSDPRVELKRTISMRQPWPYMLLEAEDGDRQWLLVVNPDGSTVNAEISQLTQSISYRIGVQNISLDLGSPSLAKDAIYYPIIEDGSNSYIFRGFAVINLSSLALNYVILPKESNICTYSKTENPLIEPRFGTCQFRVRRGKTGDRIFLIKLSPQPPDDWIGEDLPYGEKFEIWELSIEKSPRLIGSHPLALAAAKSVNLSIEPLARISLSPRLRKAGIDDVDTRDILINVEDDSLYAFNLSDEEIELIFPLGSADICMAHNGSEAVYVSSCNGYKIYRVPLPSQ